MRIGIPKEIKPGEYRVALSPAGVSELVALGHSVVVESGAGEGAEVRDEEYVRRGAAVVPTHEDVFGEAQLIIKVKEPQPEEVILLHSNHTLFTYLHLAADASLTHGLMGRGVTAVAYETVADGSGLPLLAPMSEVAGKLSAHAVAVHLEKTSGGRGVLMGGVTGVPPARVLIIGAGTVGLNSALVAAGLGAQVYLYDRDLTRLRTIAAMLGDRILGCFSSEIALEEQLPFADAVIGAVLIPGARAPRVLRREHLSLMRQNALLLDVAIDQGGCFETSQPTTHLQPTYVVDDVVHYCVTNMPGAVPVTASRALSNATLPFILELANSEGDLYSWSSALRTGLNVIHGAVTNAGVADAHQLEYVSIDDLTAVGSAAAAHKHGVGG